MIKAASGINGNISHPLFTDGAARAVHDKTDFCPADDDSFVSCQGR